VRVKRKQQTAYAATLSVLCGVFLKKCGIPLTLFVVPLQNTHFYS
jgi:hypothetical protein